MRSHLRRVRLSLSLPLFCCCSHLFFFSLSGQSHQYTVFFSVPVACSLRLTLPLILVKTSFIATVLISLLLCSSSTQTDREERRNVPPISCMHRDSAHFPLCRQCWPLYANTVRQLLGTAIAPRFAVCLLITNSHSHSVGRCSRECACESVFA